MLCYVIVMLVKYDDAVIFSFARAYSFHQAENHGNKVNLKSGNIGSLPGQSLDHIRAYELKLA